MNGITAQVRLPPGPTPGMDKVRVQIWKPVGDYEYELVWEHQEQGLEIGPVGTLWRVCLILCHRCNILTCTIFHKPHPYKCKHLPWSCNAYYDTTVLGDI